MPNTILVLLETKAGKIKKSSFELLSEASRVADAMKGEVKGLLIGEGCKGAAPEAGQYGATEVFLAENAAFKSYNVGRYAAATIEALEKSGAKVLMGSASVLGRDLLPRVAARLDSGMLTECTSLRVEGENIIGKRPIYAGKVFVDAKITGSKVQVITCRMNVFEINEPDTSKSATIVEIGGDAASMTVKSEVVETLEAKSDKLDLMEANVIVAGGRSLKSEEGFEILQELADTLGAAVGASRAAVDAGYVPHEIQVGQTGKTVNPNLYLAFGISGAIQHLAGMRTSKVIVAVNSDPEAPIFQKCDYGIVGDLFALAPKFNEEFKKILQD